jgi:hypothetical protein
MKKAVYIKQLKRLIKKYHPDLCNDGHLELLYNEITKKLTGILNKIKTDGIDEKTSSENNINTNNYDNEIIKIKNQDYVYYKLGIKYYKNIHPNQFYKRNLDRTYETKKYDDLVSALNNIFLSFNLSEYYFNKLIEEYPQSSWAEDAKEKIKLLKKLHKSYENIDLEEHKIINSESFINKMGLKII